MSVDNENSMIAEMQAEYSQDEIMNIQHSQVVQQNQMRRGPSGSRGVSHNRRGSPSANLSPSRLKSDQQRSQETKIAEKCYRLLFDSKQLNAQGMPSLTDMGRQVVPMMQVQVNTLYKRSLDSFSDEFPDANIAQLHFNHHTKRRMKNLLRANGMIRGMGDPQTSMPNLPASASHNNKGQATYFDASPTQAYQSNTITTRNISKKNSAMMIGLAQRGIGSKSVAMRPPNMNVYAGTLLNRDDLNVGLSRVSGRHNLNKSTSMASLNNSVEKIQRSQLNIDKKMREDFDRLQKQLSKREERDKQAQEAIRYAQEERVHKASLMSQKGQVALDKVKKQQRRVEMQASKSYKQNLVELEERRQKALQDATGKASHGKREFLEKERANIARFYEDKQNTDQSIVEQLYSLEVKLKVGQQRAKNWQDENIKGKAHDFNQRVETIKEVRINGAGEREEKEKEKLSKMMAKQKKMAEFTKMKADEQSYISAQRQERAQVNQQKVEQVKKTQKRQHLQVQRKQDAKEAIGQQRTTDIRDQVYKQAEYKREAARLRAEEQKEMREQQLLEKEQQKYAILEKHLNIQSKLEFKKQVIGVQGQQALEISMQTQLRKQEEKRERERQQLAAEKAQAKAAKKPKKQAVEVDDQ